MSQICPLCNAFPDPTMRVMKSWWDNAGSRFSRCVITLCSSTMHCIVLHCSLLHYIALQWYIGETQCNGGSGPLWASPVVCQRRLYTDLHWNFELTPARPPKTAIYRTIPKILNSILFNSARILLWKVASIISLNQSIDLAGDWMLFWFGCWLLLPNQGEV